MEFGIEIDLFMYSLFNLGYQSFCCYFLEVNNFFKKMGRIFVVFFFSLGFKELFDRMVSEIGWSYKVYFRNNFGFELVEY